jgi:hypothetical protein
MKSMRVVSILLFSLVTISGLAHSQMSKVKTVWIIMMENHNWTASGWLVNLPQHPAYLL